MKHSADLEVLHGDGHADVVGRLDRQQDVRHALRELELEVARLRNGYVHRDVVVQSDDEAVDALNGQLELDVFAVRRRHAHHELERLKKINAQFSQ